MTLTTTEGGAMALATMHCGCEVVLPEPSGPEGRLADARCPRHGRSRFHTVLIAVPNPVQPAYVHASRDVTHAEMSWTYRYEWRLQS